jgi:hypothetical protein
MNERIIKVIYATLQIKKVPFTMYKTNKNTTTVFKFEENVIQVTDEEVVLNGEVLGPANSMANLIKIILT